MPRECRRELRAEGAMSVQTFLVRFFDDRAGATAIEYALVACGIAMAIVSIIGTLGETVEAKFELVSTSLK